MPDLSLHEPSDHRDRMDVLYRFLTSEKYGEHTEAGKYTIARWLETYTKHPYDHGDQLVRATKGQA